jgi:type II secretory pathway component PulF
MAESPGFFPDYLMALCRAGEDSGCLPEVLDKASVFFDRLRKLKQQLTSALIYPAFLGVLSLVTIGLAFTFIIPRISFVYEEFQTNLPWQTEVLLAIGRLWQSDVLVIALVSCGVMGVLSYLWLSRQKRASVQNGKYYLPLVGTLIARAELADQLSVAGMLLNNGVSLPQAVRVTTSLTGHRQQRREFERIAAELEVGTGLADAIVAAKSIPGYAKKLIALGEQADCLAESLENGSEIIKGDVEQKLILMTTLFEPIMVLSISALIGFIVFSILIPIFNMDFLTQ